MNAAQRRRILIVEDEPLVAMLLEDMIIDLGHEVVGPALRLETAFDLVDAERLDAAILDVNLGSGRSYSLAEKLAAKRIPFAFATGYGSPGMNWEERVPVLRKPFEQKAVNAVVADLLGG